MLKLVGTLLALVIAGAGFSGAPPQNAGNPPAAIPAEAADAKNPVKPTADSITRAKKIYKVDCEICHGEDGGGKGEIAVSANYSIKDYRKAETFKDLTDGQIYYMIQKGIGTNMPPEEGRAKNDDVWNLVIYLRSFSNPSILPAEKK